MTDEQGTAEAEGDGVDPEDLDDGIVTTYVLTPDGAVTKGLLLWSELADSLRR